MSEITSETIQRVAEAEPAPDASPEHPVYRKVVQDDGNLFLITCDEGWRLLIVCADLYENVADWLLGLIGRQPYARSHQ
jgi:hypothetical protein